MKTKIILLLAFIFISTSAQTDLFAQEEKTTQEMLMAKEWKWLGTSPDRVSITIYDKTHKFNKRKIHNSRLDQERYYLSDTIDTEFNLNNVGKRTKGKFIIQKVGKEFGSTIVREILELSDTKLTLKWRRHPGQERGIGQQTDILKFVAQ